MDVASPVRRWYAARNVEDMSVADETVGFDVVIHAENAPDIVGIDAYKQMVIAFWDAFEPLSLTVDQVIADGDRVRMRSHFAATLRRRVHGVAADGQAGRVTLPHHLPRRGRWVEARTMPDSLSMIRQLGAMPETSMAVDHLSYPMSQNRSF